MLNHRLGQAHGRRVGSGIRSEQVIKTGPTEWRSFICDYRPPLYAKRAAYIPSLVQGCGKGLHYVKL